MRYPVSSATTKPAAASSAVRSRTATQNGGGNINSNSRKWVNPLIKVLVPLVIVYCLITARPGDLLFTPKLLVNNIFTPPLTVLADRVGAYKSLAGQGSCAQLVLAENEIIDSLAKLRPVTIAEQQSVYKQISETTLELKSLQSDCKLNPPIIAISDLYWLLAATDGDNVTINQELYKPYLVQYDAEYTKLKAELTAATDLDANSISKANVLLLDINNAIFTFDKLGKDIETLEQATALIGISKNLIYVRQIINAKDSNYFPWQGDVILLCTVFKDKAGCDSIRLNAALNSIRIAQQPAQISAQGLKLFSQYYKQVTNGSV